MTAPVNMPEVVRDPASVLDSIVDSIPATDVVLVLHSNAGLYAESIARRCSVRGVVFVDAGIPKAFGTQPLAPEGLLAQLRPLADSGAVLPPWDQWFDPADIAELFPDAYTQERLTAGLPCVSLVYVESHLMIERGWVGATSAAYLAFGDTYATELGRARKYGWPTTVLEGRHLHMLIDPHTVAAELLALIRACCASG